MIKRIKTNTYTIHEENAYGYIKYDFIDISKSKSVKHIKDRQDENDRLQTLE